MGSSKLREWVVTVTGKGDRWGRDRVGRSEPAFLSASTIALPPSTCTARREAGQLCGRLLFLLRGRPTVGCCVSLRPVPGGESASCVRLQWLFCRLCACSPLPCHTHCPSQQFAPVQFCFAPVHSMCARIIKFVVQQFASCKTVPLAAATRACRGGPCAGSFDCFLFPAESIDPGPWLV